MKEKKFYSKTLGLRVRRINRTYAMKFYALGETIYLQPCKVEFDDEEQLPVGISVDKSTPPFTDAKEEFLDIVTDYESFLTSKDGRYTHFYIAENNNPKVKRLFK